MFGTIRKHQTWLWAIIITVIVISFVVFFSPYSKVNSDVRRGNYGSINGERVTEDDFSKAQREVYLRYFLTSGKWPDEDARRSGFDPMRETYQWLLLVQEQEKNNVHVGTELVAEFAHTMVRPFERMGITSPITFVSTVLRPRGFSMDDFERFVRHYLGIQELIATVGVSGKLVTPAEARSLYQREHQELSSEAVFFSSSNYLSSVSINPDVITQFYSNRLANYRIPERVQVAYVKFNVTNYLKEAEAELMKTNLAEIVEANYKRLGTNYFSDAKTPEEAKSRLRQEIIRSKALDQARKQAAEFAGPLFDLDPMRAENLEKLAKEKGLPVSTTEPFTEEEGPSHLEVGPDFAKLAFSRTPEEPFSSPIRGTDGVYIIALNKRLPSENPPLDQVRDKVTADYRRAQAISIARQAGTVFHTTLTNALAHGKTFAAACMEAKLHPVALPPFSLSTRGLPEVEDRVNLNQLKQIAFSTEPGHPSNFQMTSDGGIIVFVKEKLPLDEKKMNEALPEFVNYVRQTRQNEAFNEWFRKQAERGLRDTPLAQQNQAPPEMSGKASGSARPVQKAPAPKKS